MKYQDKFENFCARTLLHLLVVVIFNLICNLQVAYNKPCGENLTIISNGYGYVHFTSQDSAEKAIKELNETNLNGLNSDQKVLFILIMV